MNDLRYNEGVGSKWSVLYIPEWPRTDIEYLSEGDEWTLDYRDGHRMFKLRATEPGIYQVTQEIYDVLIQISSVSVK